MFISATYGEGKKTLGEQAYEAIRREILSLRLKPGQSVYESDFANMLSMSRTPIREAVRTLLLEELIEVLPQRGMKIALISEKKVEETRFIRESLEVNALRKTAQVWDATAEKFQKLEQDLGENLAIQRESCIRADSLLFMQADEDFHEMLLTSFGNDTLVSIVSQIRGHLNRVRLLSLHESHKMDLIIREHEQVLSALRERDETMAVSTMTVHLSRVNEDIHLMKKEYPDYFVN